MELPLKSKQTGSNKMQTIPLEWASFWTLFRHPVILIVPAFRDFTLNLSAFVGYDRFFGLSLSFVFCVRPKKPALDKITLKR